MEFFGCIGKNTRGGFTGEATAQVWHIMGASPNKRPKIFLMDDDARRHSVRVRAELLAATQQRESRQAQAMIDAFVAQAVAAGLPCVPLQAHKLSGRRRRTDLCGWYLRNDHSAAVGDDGRYYRLTTPDGRPQADPPPLVLGRGGKDGESIDLADALKRALAGEIP